MIKNVMRKVIFIIFLLLIPSFVFAGAYGASCNCPVDGVPVWGYVRFDILLTGATYTVPVTVSSVNDGYATHISSTLVTRYLRAYCDGSLTTPILGYYASLTPVISNLLFVPDSDGTSVEVISFAVGGLMGLAFAVASVYKW